MPKIPIIISACLLSLTIVQFMNANKPPQQSLSRILSK